MSTKRSIEDIEDDSAKSERDRKTKKRFVWPEALHRDFMRAIFSVGLRFCTAKKAQAMLGGKYDVDSIESCLHHFRSFNESILKLHETHARRKKSRVVSGLTDLSSELVALNKSITTQLHLLDKYKASIAKLILIRDDLARRIDAANSPKTMKAEVTRDAFDVPVDLAAPSFDISAALREGGSAPSQADISPSPSPSPSTQLQMLRGIGVGTMGLIKKPELGCAPRQRPELSMLSAMRSHMSMHRELLDFNSKYTATARPPAQLVSQIHGSRHDSLTASSAFPSAQSSMVLGSAEELHIPPTPFSFDEATAPLSMGGHEFIPPLPSGEVDYSKLHSSFAGGKPEIAYLHSQSSDTSCSQSDGHAGPKPIQPGPVAGDDLDLFDFLF